MGNKVDDKDSFFDRLINANFELNQYDQVGDEIGKHRS